MQKEIGMMLTNGMTHALQLRGELIKNRLELMDKAMENEDKDAVYRHLFELAKLTETLCKELREATAGFFSDLQTVGFYPRLLPYPHSGEVDISVEDGCLRMIAPGILPFNAGGSVYYLHEQIRWALEGLIREGKFPRPLFTERCAVVFIHHYASKRGGIRYLRDYDNVEHRCITNALAALAMWGDSPECMIAMDILAPGDHDHTEIMVMPMDRFRAFALSEKTGFSGE